MFKNKEDKDLIFRSDPYFMVPRGLYLNQRSLSFDPERDVPSIVPLWVRLPYLPLHCWNDETLQAIGKSLRKYIDKAEPKGPLFSCARICVEVDLENGLPEIVGLWMGMVGNMPKKLVMSNCRSNARNATSTDILSKTALKQCMKT